jgi:hypothetical protein
MGRNSSKTGREDLGFVSIPILEAHLRAYIEAGDAPNALSCFEQLLRRRRTPQQATCTALLMLCVMQAPHSAMYVLESMGERTIDVDDFNRIVRLFLQKSPDAERLARFQEAAIDLLSFSDDAMHNYFAHLATLLNTELHETLSTGRDSSSDVSLITHKRQTDAAVYLCKKGTMATPIASLLLAGMGGREGAQNEAEMVQLSTAPTGLATDDAIINARALMSQMPLNESQRLAVEAALTRRLTLIQVRRDWAEIGETIERMTPARWRRAVLPFCRANVGSVYACGQGEGGARCASVGGLVRARISTEIWRDGCRWGGELAAKVLAIVFTGRAPAWPGPTRTLAGPSRHAATQPMQ